MLITNEEIGEEFCEQNNFQDTFSLNSFSNNYPYNNPSNLNHHLSAQKYPKISMIMSSAKKIPDSASKLYTNQANSHFNNNTFFEPDPMNNHNNHHYQNQLSNSIYRRSMSVSEYKQHPANNLNTANNSTLKNFTLNNSSKKITSGNIPSYANNLLSSSYKSATKFSNPNNPNIHTSYNHMNQINHFNAETDIDMILNGVNNNNNYSNDTNMHYANNHSHPIHTSAYRNNNGHYDYNGISNSVFGFGNNNENILSMLKAENEDLKKNYFDLKTKFIETVQIKENQIKNITANMNMALDNCEKLIKEAEENYLNIKLVNDRLLKDLEIKDSELKTLNLNFRNSELTSLKFKEDIDILNNEISTIKNQSGLKELENQLQIYKKNYDKIANENTHLKRSEKELISEIERIKTDNYNIKINSENYKSENLSYKTQVECLKKSNESLLNDNGRFKNDIESYKNELNSNKEKLAKMKSEAYTLKQTAEKLQQELIVIKNSNIVNAINHEKEIKENNNINSNLNTNNNTKKNAYVNNSAISKSNNNEIPPNKNQKNINSNNNANSELISQFKAKIQEIENEIKAKNSHIMLLENENSNLKIKLSAFDDNSINEYEKLVEDSLQRLKEYEMKLNLSNEKISFYEKMLKFSQGKEEHKIVNVDNKRSGKLNKKL